MKPQDIIFIIALIVLFKKPALLLWTGLTCFLLAIPLFSQWIFFTAERLTWYGAAFILGSLLIQLKK